MKLCVALLYTGKLLEPEDSFNEDGEFEEEELEEEMDVEEEMVSKHKHVALRLFAYNSCVQYPPYALKRDGIEGIRWFLGDVLILIGGHASPKYHCRWKFDLCSNKTDPMLQF